MLPSKPNRCASSTFKTMLLNSHVNDPLKLRTQKQLSVQDMVSGRGKVSFIQPMQKRASIVLRASFASMKFSGSIAAHAYTSHVGHFRETQSDGDLHQEIKQENTRPYLPSFGRYYSVFAIKMSSTLFGTQFEWRPSCSPDCQAANGA